MVVDNTANKELSGVIRKAYMTTNFKNLEKNG